MRKAFIIFALAAAVSCIKDNPFVEKSMNGVILFDKPVTSNMMKSAAGPVQGDYPEDESMGVFAYHSALNSGQPWTSDITATAYFEDIEFKYRNDLKAWAGVTPCYWPSNGSLIFAGFSPYSQVGGTQIQNASFDVDQKALLISGYKVETYVPMTEAQMYAQDVQYTNKCQSDLMYFLPKSDVNNDFLGSTRGASYVADFYHALAQVVFNVEADTQDDIEYIRLSEIVLTDIASKGDFSARIGRTQAGEVTWALSDGGEWMDLKVLYNVSGMKLSIDQRKVVELLTIPVGEHDIQVTYSLNVNGTLYKETLTYHAKWEAGKKYVYNLTLGTNNIQLVPQITTDWITNE